MQNETNNNEYESLKNQIMRLNDRVDSLERRMSRNYKDQWAYLDSLKKSKVLE